jgi:hypothetical protein
VNKRQQKRVVIEKLEEWGLLRSCAEFFLRDEAYGCLCSGVIGKAFEYEFSDECDRRGLRYKNVAAQRWPYDHRVNHDRVQVKASGQPKFVDIRPARPLVGQLVRQYARTDFDVLVMKNLNTGIRYFVPTSCLIDPANPEYTIKWFHWNRFKEFAEDWSVFKESDMFAEQRITEPSLEPDMFEAV